MLDIFFYGDSGAICCGFKYPVLHCILSGNSGGISSHVQPSRSRPPVLWKRPPCCLKKNGTSVSRHCWRSERTQSRFIGLAPTPLSPPAITHWSCDIELERSTV